MPRYNRLRNHGLIPERQHDAFLMALLLAVCLNIAFFAVQAMLPLFVNMLYMLAPAPSREEDVTSYTFEYVDPDLISEYVDPNEPHEAESTVSRRARQVEAEPDLPDGAATVLEGVDEQLSAPDGNPGENIAYLSSPGLDIPAPADDAMEIDSDLTEPQPDETPEPSLQPELSPLPPLSQLLEIEQRLEESPPPEPHLTELFEEIPPPPVDIPREIEPEEIEPTPEPVEAADAADGPEPEPSAADMVDLAMLPEASDGYFDPETRRLEELVRRPEEPRPPVPTLRVEEVPESFQPEPPSEPAERPRSGRAPVIRRVGGASESGGAPPRRNVRTSTNLLSTDASMRLLEHRYGPYMRQVWEKLQASLTREMIMSPLGYSRGQVKIRFGISPDGGLTFQETVFPLDGTMASERAMSERMLREAGPFDPLTPAMAEDPLFQQMSVTVNLY